MGLRDEVRTPDVYEPILEKKDCKVRILGAETKPWKPKVGTGVEKETNAMKLQIEITDEDARCENADAKPSKRIDDYINLEKHPYVGKDGEVAYMGTSKVYQLEQALGFEPVFVDKSGKPVDAHITKTGKKVCPEGASQKLNADFLEAYFDANDCPVFGAWEGKEIVAHVGMGKASEEFSAKNEVKKYIAKAE